MENLTLPPDFDLWGQAFTVFTQDGSSITLNMAMLDTNRLYGVRSAINYGTQVGASLILLLVLLLLTSSAKRKSPIFLINALCLLVNVVRCLLYCCYFTGGFWNPYSQLANDWSRISSSELATSVAANVLSLLVAIMVMGSLSLQVWVVCVTTSPLQRYITMGLTSVIAIIALGYKAAVIIYNIKQTLNFESMEPYKYLAGTGYVVQAVAIWVYSCVFTFKLGHAIVQRHRLNMPQFGPMQIVFIMSFQTLLIPGV